MNKIVKIFSIMLIAIMLLLTINSTFIYAQEALPNTNEYDPGNNLDVPTEVTNMVGIIANLLQIIGIVLSVIVLVLLGIKYMVGSASEKAEYKKSMIPFLVGTIFIAATGTIIKLIANLTQQAL